MNSELLQSVRSGNVKAIARCISLVENEAPGYEDFLASLPPSDTRVIGITGPPGAGKSTLVDALIRKFVSRDESVAVLCVDPSSPFNFGALLGDRIRMSDWYNHPLVYIRSLASRGSVGGLNPKIIEITDLLKVAPFKHIIIETVGVGQSEIEVAALADTTIVVLVPESGDEIQTLKAGLMEIADIFVVNKADRPDADRFLKNLTLILRTVVAVDHPIPVIKTVALENTGIDELLDEIFMQQQAVVLPERKYLLMAEKAYQLIQKERMRWVDREDLRRQVQAAIAAGNFNLYQFLRGYLR